MPKAGSGFSPPGPLRPGEIHANVAAALAEIGLDISKEFPKRLSDEDLDWELPDPAGKPLEEVRPIPDEIDRRVRELLSELGI
jgi:protein-tyrosine-phosphatase